MLPPSFSQMIILLYHVSFSIANISLVKLNKISKSLCNILQLICETGKVFSRKYEVIIKNVNAKTLN